MTFDLPVTPNSIFSGVCQSNPGFVRWPDPACPPVSCGGRSGVALPRVPLGGAGSQQMGERDPSWYRGARRWHGMRASCRGIIGSPVRMFGCWMFSRDSLYMLFSCCLICGRVLANSISTNEPACGRERGGTRESLSRKPDQTPKASAAASIQCPR